MQIYAFNKLSLLKRCIVCEIQELIRRPISKHPLSVLKGNVRVEFMFSRTYVSFVFNLTQCFQVLMFEGIKSLTVQGALVFFSLQPHLLYMYFIYIAVKKEVNRKKEYEIKGYFLKFFRNVDIDKEFRFTFLSVTRNYLIRRIIRLYFISLKEAVK